ncbi:hypothetical protein F7734_13640 [Scytonema sp. UIC 10036]|uniref:hypothetical protein n=1 Tax=Scytonema sp. UIC 10036 TaxID=2304196 RepID=UPI0012DA55DC|nr:hypothetical protein [Scytonema sp. UIC 10036]MUG93415.1 hypothetical protein [Scytonema sp. UIC 10036]
MKTITRKQLKSLGCSNYLAKKLTVGVMYTKANKEHTYVCQGVVKRIEHTLKNSLRLQHRNALLLEGLLEKLRRPSSALEFQQIVNSPEVAEVENQIDNFNKRYSEICRKSTQAIQMISDAIEGHYQTMQEYADSLSSKEREEFLQSVGGTL